MSQYSLYGQRISETYPRLLQITSGDTVLDGSGDTRSLYVNGNFSADTIFIGSSDLNNIFAPIGAIGSGATTFIRNGLNTYTGGTLINPTVNISAATLDTIFVSGVSIFSSITYNDGNQSSGKILTSDNNGNATWQIPTSTGLRTYFFTKINTETPNYYLQQTSIYLETGQTITNLNVVNNQILAEFITSSGLTSSFFIPSGAFSVYVVGYKSGGIKNVELYANVYKKSSAGTETLLVTTSNSSTLDSTQHLLVMRGFLSSAITMSYGDRLETNILASVSGGGSDPDIVLEVGDNTYSRVEVTASSADATNFVPYNGAVYDLNLGSKKISSNEVYTQSFSANSIYSGNTNLYSIFQTVDNNSFTYIQSGLNTYTGGTINAPTVNISAATLSYLSASTVSGGTFYGDGSGLSGIGNSITVSLTWRFDSSTTETDPGNGDFRFNSTNPSSISKIYVDTTTSNGINASVILSRLKSGSEIYVQQKDNANTAILFSVTSSTIDNSGWFTIPVSYVSDNGGIVPQNNKDCLFLLFNAPSVDSNTYVTGFTYDNANKFTIKQNDGVSDLSAVINTFTGLTVGGLSAISISAETIQSNSLSGTSTRFVQTNSNGVLMSFSVYGLDNTIKSLLEDRNNWYGGAYTGTTITGTFQGQKHYNDDYFFEAVENNFFIRLPRV